jgi:hypothetical protein
MYLAFCCNNEVETVIPTLVHTRHVEIPEEKKQCRVSSNFPPTICDDFIQIYELLKKPIIDEETELRLKEDLKAKPDPMKGFYKLFNEGFTVNVMPYPYSSKGKGTLLVHPDDMPKSTSKNDKQP